MSFSSLMGAIGYKEFISSDDDIDVLMTRSEYKKFLSKYHSDDIFVENIYKYEDYRLPF